MATFTIGEEVLYDDIRFVIAGMLDNGTTRYRLLATRPEGARIVWATKDEIEKIGAYTESRDDTEKI